MVFGSLFQAAENSQHEAAVRAGGVGPCVLQRAEARTPLRYRVYDVQEVTVERARRLRFEAQVCLVARDK